MTQSIRIGRQSYRLESMGSGSFVELYRGTLDASPLNNDAHSIVLKRMQDEYVANAVVRDRFELEFTLLKELANQTDRFLPEPAFSEIDGTPCMTYTYMPGATLISLLKDHANQNFTLERCVRLMQSLLGSLNYLHQQSPAIVHSDISPENILVENDQVRLIDFGCAQHITEECLAAAWMGKPGYLSPEQARGEHWSVASDLYQAGVIFFELVCGVRWNQAGTKGERIAFSSNPGIAHHRIAAAPVKARPLLRSMLAPEPVDRPASATLCLQRLGYILAQL